MLGRAASHRDGFTPLDRARFDAFVRRFSHAPVGGPDYGDGGGTGAGTPAIFPSLLSLGSIRVAQGNTAEGESLLRRALALDPGNIDVTRGLAIAQAKAGREQEALKTLQTLADQRPGDPQPLRALGELNFALGRFGDAVTAFRKAGEDPALKQDIAICLLMGGNTTAANLEFEQYLGQRQAGNDPLAPLERGRVAGDQRAARAGD